MQAAGVTVIGCDPLPPDFETVASAFNLPYRSVDHDPKAVAEALTELAATKGPSMIEIKAPGLAKE